MNKISKISQVSVKQIHNGIVSDCLQKGITDAKTIRKIALAAAKNIGTMSVAGIKAAQTKKQTINVAY